MSDDRLLEIHQQQRTGQDKYIYFVLTVTGAAIAFALNRAEGKTLTLYLIPWGISLLTWGLSFVFGCLHLMSINSILGKNVDLILIQKGENPQAGKDPLLIKKFSENKLKDIEGVRTKSANYVILLFLFLLLGVVSYVTWQIIEMSI